MTALDTNVLARFYIEDEADAEAGRQRAIARAVLASERKCKVARAQLRLKPPASVPKA